MTDMFLEALTATPVKRSGPHPSIQKCPPLPPPPDKPIARNWTDKYTISDAEIDRPDYAADIDRMVADLVSDGEIIWDGEQQSYRRPRSRHWKFNSV